MIKITRRRFVKLVMLLVGGSLAGLTARNWPLQGNRHALSEAEQALVTRYVDLLIPADETPGALELDVHRQVMEHTATHSYLLKSIKDGGDWLDREARRLNKATNFLSLAPQDQIRLIEQSEASQLGTAQRRLFSQLRQISFQYYYGDSRSWMQLGFQGPPQPLGHFDYQLPPNTVRL